MNPDDVLAAARAQVSRLEAVSGVLGESDSAEARTFAGGFETGMAFSAGAANQRTENTEEFIARSTNRLQVLAEKRSEEEQLLENVTARLARLCEGGFVRPMTSISSNRIGRPSRRVEGKVGRCGSGTRCTSEGGRCTDATRISSGSGQYPAGSRPQAAVSSGRFHSTLRRGNARVDGGPTQRFTSGYGCWKASRSGGSSRIC